MEKLSDMMQERLDKWRKKTLPVPSSEKVRGKVFVPRKEYGDEIDKEEHITNTSRRY